MTLTPDAVAPVMNLAKMVVAPKLTVDLTGDWLQSGTPPSGGQTLHITNDKVHGHPQLFMISKVVVLWLAIRLIDHTSTGIISRKLFRETI